MYNKLKVLKITYHTITHIPFKIPFKMRLCYRLKSQENPAKGVGYLHLQHHLVLVVRCETRSDKWFQFNYFNYLTDVSLPFCYLPSHCFPFYLLFTRRERAGVAGMSFHRMRMTHKIARQQKLFISLRLLIIGTFLGKFVCWGSDKTFPLIQRWKCQVSLHTASNHPCFCCFCKEKKVLPSKNRLMKDGIY